MKIIIAKDYEQMSGIAADFVANLVKNKPDLSFCLPAGGSPIGMYKNLVTMSKNKAVDFSRMRVCNMDEYVGLEKSHKQSYNYFVRHHFLDYISYDKENSHFIDATTDNLKLECIRYNQCLDQLALDLAISGFGLNGHIAFNEPNDYLHARTHVVDLHPLTVQANSRFFDKDETIPSQAFSIGIADLLMSKHLLIVASGESKASVVSRLLSDDTISTNFPASLLKTHPNCTIILDKEASKLCDFNKLANIKLDIDYKTN